MAGAGLFLVGIAGERLKWRVVQHFYFDHNATTNLAPGVISQLPALLVEAYGNASSIHYFGQMAKQRLETARRTIGQKLHCDPRDIVFTGGGTESDNLAIFGVVRASSALQKHVITSAIEHPAVLNACGKLEAEGVAVTYLPAGKGGAVEPEAVRAAIRPETVLITIMHANNETGVVQPLGKISKIARETGVPLHSDGVQTAGRIPVDLGAFGLTLYSISGHKLGAPKGVGALYVKKGTALEPMFYGGHHERDRRAGTENVPGAAAMGWALAEADWSGTAELRDRLEQSVLARVPGCSVNGAGSARLPNTTNLCFSGVEGEAMVIALDLRGYAVSSGSACSSGAVEPSHVLLAMGLSRADARSSVRISLGPENTREQVDGLIEAVVASAAHLRRLSPELVSAHA